MLHVLKTHADYNDPTWSVIIGLGIFMVGMCYYVYTILNMALKE